MRKSLLLLAAAATLASAGNGPAVAQAANQVRAHANMCMPATNDLTRSTQGIKNTTTGNRSVYCGFEVRESTSPGYDNFHVLVRNTGSVERSVSCYWTSGDPNTGYATATTTDTIPNDGEAHYLVGFDLSRPGQYATLNVRCALPPGVALEYISLEPYTPT